MYLFLSNSLLQNMRTRIGFRVRNFSKRWRYWILQFIGWVFSLIRDYYATQIIFGGTMSDLIGWFPKGLSGLALLVLVLSIIIILIYDFIDTKKQTNTGNIKLSNHCALSYDENDFSKEAYDFTWINESGSNLKKCFVLLDGLHRRQSSKGKWELVFQDAVAHPVIWNIANVGQDGKIDINNNDRAAITLINMSRVEGWNASRKQIDYQYEFRFSLLGNDSIGLYTGWEHRILLGLRATDENGTNMIVRYYLYLQVDGKPHGVTIKGMSRLK